MRTENVQLREQISAKAKELEVWEEALTCALYILSQNRDLVNALDNKTEMDEYIYHAIIKSATDKRRQQAESLVEGTDEMARQQAEKDLTTLSREELITDPHYRAVLPIVAKIIVGGPILRLHVDEAAETVFKLADFKRKHRAMSITEIIIAKCGTELKSFHNHSTAVLENEAVQ
jgi:hypothetical protein